MPISHGRNAAGSYDSAAFFLRHDASRTEALFWGDVEPDTLALHPRNAGVWRAAAPKIVAGALRAVFIECSWPAGRVDALLFGHLSPPHLVQELRVLADAVAAARAEAPLEPLRSGAAGLLTRKRKREAAPKGVLASVRVFVIHCKDDLEGQFAAPIQHVIADQVRMLVDEAGLGCEVVAVEQGTRICSCRLRLFDVAHVLKRPHSHLNTQPSHLNFDISGAPLSVGSDDRMTALA
jgi:hypothetical protein